MKNQTYIACYKKKATDTDGYLFLQSKGRKNRTKKALGIKVNYDKFVNCWNEREQRFKSGMPQYKLLNEKIEKGFADYIKDTGEIVESTRGSKQSFLKFWGREIDLIPKIGSKVKHTTVKKKLEKYLLSIKKTDIDFAELTPAFIHDLHYHFQKAPELTTSTVNSYMKLINNIVRRKTKEDPYAFKVNPFSTIKYQRKDPTNRKVLNDAEINRLLTTRIKDPELDFIRDMYVFQIFASGMRVSDLCLLRWNTIFTDIKEWYVTKQTQSLKVSYGNGEPAIDYVMYKTRASIQTPLTFYVCKALLRALGDVDTFYLGIDPVNYMFRHNGEWVDNVKEFITSIESQTFKKIEPNTINYKGYIIKRDNDDVKSRIDSYIKGKGNAINSLIRSTTAEILQKITLADRSNEFVFPLLKNQDFQGISNDDRIFKDIVSKSEELHHKLLYAEKIYRRQLDKVGELCQIDDMMPHAARHTFTQLMISAGATTHSIMSELGHTTLNVTDSYIRHKKFKNNLGENFLQKIGNKTDYF